MRGLRWSLLLLAASCTFGAEPVARIEVRADRLVMVVNSLAWHEVMLPDQAVSSQANGGYALHMPLPGRNFLPEAVAGSDDRLRPMTLDGAQAWESPPVPVEHKFQEQMAAPGRFGLLFSVYARAAKGARVPVEMSLAWVPAADEAAEAEAWEELAATNEWQRLSVRLPFAVHEVKGTASLSIRSEGAIEFAGLQLEPWGDYPVFQTTPTPWMPGGTVRTARPPTLPATLLPMEWTQGAVALKLQLDELPGSPISGERTILFVGSFWQGDLEMLIDQSWIGGTTVRTPRLRQLLADGQEHDLLFAWDESEARVFADGELVGRSEMKARPDRERMGYRVWIGTHNPRARNVGGAIRDLHFYNESITPDEVTGEGLGEGPWMTPPARYVFRRDEEGVTVVLPLQGAVPQDLTVELTGIPGASASLSRQPEGAAVHLHLEPWSYAPGTMDGAILLSRSDGTTKRWPWPVRIVPAEARDRFPIGNWGSPGSVADLEWASEIGLGVIDSRNHGADYLNLVALHGLRASVNFRNIRIEPHPATPEHLTLARADAARLAQAVQPFPWVISCIHNSEGHGTDDVHLSPAALASLKAELAMEEPLLPPQDGWGDLAVRPKVDLTAFAETGIVPDDHAPLRYVKWLMNKGDGMNLSSAVLADRLHAAAPWVRMIQEPARHYYASWADTLSNWRYANSPAPMMVVWKQGLAAAQATGKAYYPLTGHCYFSPAIYLDDEKKRPVPPSGDMAAAFLWTGLAMPADEVRCFGWWQKDWAEHEQLRPGSTERIKATIAELSRLGPVVGNVPLRRADLAVLMPETNQLGRGHDEWWHAYRSLVYDVTSFFANHDLQVDFLHEDRVLSGELQHYRHLYIPGLRYQMAAVDAAVQAWRGNGGTLILDNQASPAFEADIVAPLIAAERKGMAFSIDADACAAWVEEFRPKLQPHARLEKGQAIVLSKELPGSRFVFAINNQWSEASIAGNLSGEDIGSDIVDEMQEFKEAGRVRQLSGKLEDVGVAQTITLSLLESPEAVIYDLRAGRRLMPEVDADGRLLLHLPLDPGAAAVLAIYPREATKLLFDCPTDARPGAIAELRIRLLGADGQPLQGRQGVRLEIIDPDGQPLDATAIYRLTDGQTTVRLRLPTTALAGSWRVSGRHLSSSLEAAARFPVTP